MDYYSFISCCALLGNGIAAHARKYQLTSHTPFSFRDYSKYPRFLVAAAEILLEALLLSLSLCSARVDGEQFVAPETLQGASGR